LGEGLDVLLGSAWIIESNRGQTIGDLIATEHDIVCSKGSGSLKEGTIEDRIMQLRSLCSSVAVLCQQLSVTQAHSPSHSALLGFLGREKVGSAQFR
jgi:hypothetical protein